MKEYIIKVLIPVLTVSLFITTSCSKEEVVETILYSDSFEQNVAIETQSIDTSFMTFDKIGYQYFQFEGSRNLGRFATGGLTLNLKGIETHQLLRVEFDLYIHDKWEGNGERGNTQDVFILNVGSQTDHFSSIVNTKCMTRDCEAIQSYPAIIGFGNNPENAGVTDPTLPGVCHFAGESGGTKLIKFNRIYPHTSADFKLNIAAGIKDAGPDLCLKSWSIDNLKVSSLSLLER